MKMKQLLSIAFLVSAFAIAPSFAMDPNQPPVDPNQQPPQPDGPTWGDTFKAPFKFGYGELDGFYRNVKGMTLGNEGVARFDAATNLKLFWYGLGSAVVARYIYDNLDDIKAALGLGADESEADAGQVFAALACGCDDEEEKEEVTVCALEEEKEAEALVS